MSSTFDLVVMGIDQSFTSTGWFVKEGDNFKYGLIHSDKEDNIFRRAVDVANEVGFVVNRYAPEVIALEGLPFMSKSNVTRDLAGLQFTIVNRLSLLGYDVDRNLFIIPPTQLKKHATGTGKATKIEMFESLPAWARNSIESTPKSKGRYDITDAFWLADYVETRLTESNDV